MKTVVLCGITLLAVAPAFAQTSSPADVDQANKTVTLTGCVAGGAHAAPITLSNALIIPGTVQPGEIDQTPSPVPATVSTDPTEPPVGAAPVTPSPVGTSGSKTTAAATAGTSGVVAGTAPAGSSGSTLTGYRLSGADMSSWIGKRVNVVGSFVPAAAASPTPATGAVSAPPLEFKVQTVQPASGPCPK
jgi:hypothetical protein